MSELPTPPPGFKIDGPPTPPPGFTLVPADEGARAAANTARIVGTDAVRGALGSADFLYSMVPNLSETSRGIANWFLRKTGLEPEAGNRPGEKPVFDASPTNVANKIGIPTDPKAVAADLGADPNTSLRKNLGTVARVAAGSLALAPRMPFQAAMGGLGAAGLGEVAEAVGGDRGLGEIIGSILGPAGMNAITGSVRRAAIAGPQTRATMRSAIDDAEKAGLEIPSAGQAAIGSRVSPSWVENMLAKAPGNLGPVERKAAAELSSTTKALDNAANQAYRPLHETIAGELVKRGLDAGKEKALQKVENLAAKVTARANNVPTPLSSYETTLGTLTAKNPATMELVPGAIPTGIAKYNDAFTKWKAANPGKTVPFEVSEEIRQSVGAAIKKAGPNALTPDGVDVGSLKQLYRAILDDQRAALVAHGNPDLLKAFDAKRRLYSSLMGTPKKGGALQMLEPLAGARTGEDVIQMLRGWATKNPTELKTALAFMPKTERGIITSQILNKLGRGGPNGEFSFAKFRTDWNELGKIGGKNDTVRRPLFDNVMGPDYRQNLERIFRYSDRAAQGSKVLFNPPKSGDVVVAAGSIAGLGHAAISGNPYHIGGAVGSLLAANIGLRALLSPKWVKALAEGPNYPGRFLGMLGRVAAEEQNPDARKSMKEFIDAFTSGSSR